jgi:hypothetical protein
LIVLLICSTILFLVAKARKGTLDFPASTRLASVALTPATLLEIMLDAIGTKPAYWGMIWILVAVGYLGFAYWTGTGGPLAPAVPMGEAVSEIPPQPESVYEFVGCRSGILPTSTSRLREVARRPRSPGGGAPEQ